MRFTFLAFPLFVAASQVSPVQKVLQLLDGLKGKLAADLANEAKLMDEYTSWCDSEANDKEDAITSSKRTIADASATETDAKASIEVLDSKIGSLTRKISTSESELTKATDLREREHETFLTTEKDMLDTVDSLERAETVLKNNLGLLQGADKAAVVSKMQVVAAGLSKILDAGQVTTHEKAVLESLLQAQAGDQDEDFAFQPQATAAAYSSQSGGIVDTLSDMREKADQALSSARADEMKAGHSYALLKQGLDDEIKVKKRQLAESSQEKSFTQEELFAAEEELASTKKVLEADEQYLAELKASCATKAQEWAARQKAAGEESAALDQASEALGGVSFLQTSARVRRVSTLDDPRDAAAAQLRALGNKFQSHALMLLANRAQSGPFDKVKGLLEEMIAKLVKEAAAEADQKAFCDEEMSKSKGKKQSLNQKLDKVANRIEKAVAGNAQLKEEVAQLEQEVAAIDAGAASAMQIRQGEHEEYLAASEEYKQSAAAVARAINTLEEYYNSGSFVQVSATGPSFGGAKTDAATTIVGLLEVAESDFTKLLAETEAEEENSVNAYEQLVTENKVSKASKEVDIKGKTAEISQLETALLNYKEDHATLSNEMSAVLDYVDKLKPQCETKVVSYAEKKAKREAEITGLREALATLTPTSFVQTGAFLTRTHRQ